MLRRSIHLLVLCFLNTIFLLFYWPHCVACNIYQLPDQRLNLGLGSESTKSQPLEHLRNLFNTSLKVTLHLQLLQNTGYISSPCSTIHRCSLSYTQQFGLLTLTPVQPLTSGLFSISVSLLLICYIHQCCIFLDSTYISDIIQYLSLSV